MTQQTAAQGYRSAGWDGDEGLVGWICVCEEVIGYVSDLCGPSLFVCVSRVRLSVCIADRCHDIYLNINKYVTEVCSPPVSYFLFLSVISSGGFLSSLSETIYVPWQMT